MVPVPYDRNSALKEYEDPPNSGSYLETITGYRYQNTYITSRLVLRLQKVSRTEFTKLISRSEL